MTFHLQAHGATDIGLFRSNNEDAYLPSLQDHLFLIADGLGGHQAGEVASKEAIEIFYTLFTSKETYITCVEDIYSLFRFCYEKTNELLYELAAANEQLQGMGTTFCALTFFQDTAVYSHVGDSRIYRLHKCVIEQLTQDHSTIVEKEDLYGLDEPVVGKGLLTKAMGTTPYLEPDIGKVLVEAGDLFLLATDGLTDLLTIGEIETILNRCVTIGEKVRSLIAMAKQKGGEDNITLILIEALR
jgi:PPM family protein phosphatase